MEKQLKVISSTKAPMNKNTVWLDPKQDSIKFFDNGKWQKIIGGVSNSEEVQVIEWSHTHNMNDYKDAGTYRIKGERTGNPLSDNLPIMNQGSGHTIEGILYVLDSSLANGSGKEDDCTITQFLMLSNRVGGQEGDMYMRSAYGANKDNLTWKPWEKYQTNMEVGIVTDTQSLDTSLQVIAEGGMNALTDSGIYSGIYVSEAAQTNREQIETFVMVVINNYLAVGNMRSVTQMKFATTNSGESSMMKRSTEVASTTIWGEWEKVGIVDYAELENKPQIGGVTLKGNKSAEELGLATKKELDNKAPKNGYAPELLVKFAEELVGRGVAEPQEIGKIRPTGVISIGDGNATIEKVKGKSVVWNQIMRIVAVETQFDPQIYSITFSGNAIAVTKREGGTINKDYLIITFTNNFVASRKYLLIYNLNRSDGENAEHNMIGSGIYDGTKYHDLIQTSKSDYKFFSPTESFTSTSVQVGQLVTEGIALSYTLEPVIHDLTQMFGEGNEPTTIEEFYARIPLNVTNEYNEGEIVSYNGANELKSVGFNAFNGIYAKVIGGQQYHALGNIESIGFTKEMGGETTEVVLNDEGRFTPETDGYVYAEGTDICIHLTHTYTPDYVTEYQEDILKLPNVKSIKDKDGNQLFPYGLLSAGSAHDEITATKAIKRVNRVVLNGSEQWELQSINSYGIANFITIITPLYSDKTVISDKFTRQTSMISNAKDEGFFVVSSSSYLYIRIKSTTASTVEQFKAWLSQNNVIVQTELAEPIEVDLPEHLNLIYDAWDFGTEELIAGKTTPLCADINYVFNSVDRIRENTEKNKVLEERLARLEATIA